MENTQPTVLVINSGSSSLKYELFSMDPRYSVVEGEVEGIGAGRMESAAEAADHEQAMARVLGELAETGLLGEPYTLVAVGHRVVHGGDRFAEAVVLDDEVVAHIRELADLAPLHVEPNLAGIAAARDSYPDVPHVAVFDTAFHLTLPAHAATYALPRAIAREYGVRRYGFHGTSHAYVAREAAYVLGRPLDELRLITLHLGNGASATAIRHGESIDTSMGMTPLEGLVMGSRCGDIDPAVPLLIARASGMEPGQVERLLNEESGLLGVCGARDMREVHRLAEDGDADARLAIELFCYRVKKYIGAYIAALGGADAVVFTAGIGENDADVRSRVCSGLESIGIAVDESLNTADEAGSRIISPQGSPVVVLVIPTDEESEIARLTYECVTKG